MRAFLAILISIFAQACWAEPTITLVRVVKSNHVLELVAGEKIVREFRVVFGGSPVGHKTQEGDGRTPEGIYSLDYKKSDSAFYRSIHISYPNATDIASAKARGVQPGGQVMIHGQKNGFGWLSAVTQRFNWTNGCIALSNADMDIVWALVKEGTPIEIRP